ncbi:hypothetical protein D9613_002883 [Agrocybe pediades]|uniref:Cytochrome b561 domain-containing protein n=1 Tax=Agrocybe pediades TaxID=84607 RepID=A0A8H4QP03_9AGAR|nr:hypothetical protein D9613_002883 [Agrocybe pediades]KAF9567637.1 hypothetical protein CPC08DRAFT_703167 [Agrocybe pediades]
MSTSASSGNPVNSHYELLPASRTDAQRVNPPASMGPDQQLKAEGRPLDGISRQTALTAASAVMAVTWTAVLMNGPLSVGWFAFHPPLQTLAMLLFTFGIITLQPTNQPKTKAAGLVRHQMAVFIAGFPLITLGTMAVSYNKWLRDADHFTTWHGTFGIICMLWLLFQVFLGAGSVWFDGALFGGGMKAKMLWKYHRLSGYILFPLLLFTVHLGGAWSSWGSKHIIWIIRFSTYTIAPLAILVGVYRRIRTSKMQFLN